MERVVSWNSGVACRVSLPTWFFLERTRLARLSRVSTKDEGRRFICCSRYGSDRTAYEVRSVMDDNCRLHADEVLGAMFLNVRVLCEEYVFHGSS